MASQSQSNFGAPTTTTKTKNEERRRRRTQSTTSSGVDAPSNVVISPKGTKERRNEQLTTEGCSAAADSEWNLRSFVCSFVRSFVRSFVCCSLASLIFADFCGGLVVAESSRRTHSEEDFGRLPTTTMTTTTNDDKRRQTRKTTTTTTTTTTNDNNDCVLCVGWLVGWLVGLCCAWLFTHGCSCMVVHAWFSSSHVRACVFQRACLCSSVCVCAVRFAGSFRHVCVLM